MLNTLKKSTLLGVSATCLLSMPAMAQSGREAGAETSSADIIVTARRIEERLQDVPISITVYSQEQLDRRNIVDATDLTLYTPSLASNTVFGSKNTSFSIRGFTQDTGTEPTVGVYFADVVAPRGGAVGFAAGDGAGPGSFFDLENVQILKGPQGTLFGRNTTGGAILLSPKRPTNNFEGYLEGGYGNLDTISAQGVVNIPIAEKGGFRFGFDHMQRDGYLRNTSGYGANRFNDTDYLALRASLLSELTPDLENYLVASYTKSNTTGYVSKTFDGNPEDPTGLLSRLINAELARPESSAYGFYSVQSGNADPFNNLSQWQIVNKTSWTASDDLTVRNIVSYGEVKQRLSSEVFATFLDASVATGGAVPARQVPLNPTLLYSVPGGGHANQWTFTEELRLEGNSAGGRLVWQAGAYAEISKPNGLVGSRSAAFIHCPDMVAMECINPLGVGSVSETTGGIDYSNYGLYAQASYDLTDQFTLTGGIRYTWNKASMDLVQKRFSYPRSLTTPVPPAAYTCQDATATYPDCETAITQKSEKPTWLVSVDYKPGDDWLLYAKYARGYRAGGIAPRAPVAFRTFEPEKVDSYELGMKTSFRGAVSGTFNIAAFYNDFQNQQLLVGYTPKVPGLTSVTGVANAGASRIQGFEVETTFNLLDGLNLDIGYSYLDAKITNAVTIPDIDDTYQPESQPEKGRRFPLTPKHQVSATAAYTLPLDESVGRITASVTYSYVSKRESGVSNPLYNTLASRSLLNASLDWKSIAGSPVDAQFYVTNLTDEEYYTYLVYSTSVGRFGQVGQPRMYGAKLRYNF